jgi:hypothetical protein
VVGEHYRRMAGSLTFGKGSVGSSGSPANLIADPLGADGKHNHHERSEGNPKDRQEDFCGFHIY